MLIPMDVPMIFFREEQNILRRRKFKIDGTGTNESADYKNRTAESVNILTFHVLRSFW